MKKIPPFRLVPEPMTDAARALQPFKWASPEVGKRHRIGGEPENPVADWPQCPDCREPMTFYGQLDSINDEYCIADVGLIYVFLCLDCFEVHAVVDSS